MAENDEFFLRDNKNIENNSGLSELSRQTLHNSKAENTIKAYSADWRDFADWCERNGAPLMPTTPEAIVNYISSLAEDAKANTVARRITAISENHIAAGYDRERNPAHDGIVRNAIAAIRREKGTFQHGKAPILYETLQLIADGFEGQDLATLRDRALILLGFAGAFRRSELAAVQVEHLSFTPQGLVVFIPRAKGDQQGRGSTIAIPFAPEKTICAARAVRDWLTASGLEAGPLFRPFKNNGQLRDSQLSDKSVALVVKKYVRLAGLDPAHFAGHSLRRGFATSAAQHDVDTLSIMRQTRHKSEKMVHRYIEQGTLFKDNPLSRIFSK